jgi:pimeloyl-ACP methyl ester carboxylesterase
MWAPNIEALSRCLRTFALDQIGDIGRTTCLRPIRSMGDLMRWLDQVFDALELQSNMNLVGISYGGGLAAQYLLHRPERLSKAVLIAPAASVLPISKQFLTRLTLAAVASRRFLPPLLHWMFADMARKDPAWIEATLQQLFIAMKSIDRRLPIPPVMPDAAWAALCVPTLLLVGEHETIYSAAAAVTRLRRIAPQVQTQIVPGAGHDLTFAQPGIVNQAMLDFLRQTAA